MEKIFYIADQHYGHKNIMSYDCRPFKTVEDMDAEMTRRWNETVAENDTVYVLGDISWHSEEKTCQIFSELNGKKILLRGNHDKFNSAIREQFIKIYDYLEIKDNDRPVVLCHYPMPAFKNSFYGTFHLYGHVHVTMENNMIDRLRYEKEELYSKPCEMYNVGCMMPWMDYTPKTLDEIVEEWHKSNPGRK